MPSCALSSINSAQKYDFQQFKGKVLYVDFWASWCPPCAKSFTFLNELHRELKEQGLEIVVVNLDEQLEDAKAFLAKHPNNLTAAVDMTKQCAQNFNVEGMPSTYIIDRKGIVRKIHLGFRSEDAEELRNLVKQLLAET